MDAALDLAWGQYRGWAQRARTIRARLDRWRMLALALTVAGALLATLATQWPIWVPALASGARILSAASCVAMVLAAWTARSMLDTTTEKTGIQARALAERAKSEAFRYATRVPPYDGAGAAQKLLDRLSALMDEGKDIPANCVADASKDQPVFPLSVKDYVATRFNDQLKRYYEPKADANERNATRCTRAIQLLSAIAAVLGGLGTVRAGSGLEVWIATLGAVTSAIGAYALVQRYQRLAATYRLAADRLKLLYASWSVATGDAPKVAADCAFILDVEGMLNGENQAWMTDSLNKPAGDARPGVQTGNPARVQ